MNRLTYSGVVVVLMIAGFGSAESQQGSRTAMPPGIEQTAIVGSVHDSTGRPLEGAEVRLDSASALTDARGEFTLISPNRATLLLHVRRLGYLAKDTLISSAASEGRVIVSVTLAPNALQLGVIVVEGRALDTRLWDAGYYHRKRLGAGRFVGPEELERFGSGLATVVRETPRVQMDRENNQEFAYARVGGHRCRMNVLVDGNFARFASPGASGNGPHDSPDPGVGLDGVVPREDIRAVEIYPSLTSVPSQFLRIGPASNQASQGRAGRLSGAAAAGRPSTRQQEEGPSDAACGAIVIWTRWYASRRQPAANSP